MQMTSIWLKRLIVCSVTFTGGYATLWPRNTTISFSQSNKEKSSDLDDLSSYIYLPENAGNDFDDSMESNWNLRSKANVPIYWKLFRLCKSKDMKVRHKAIETLSKSSLEKWQCVAVAQACDIDTSVGLARSLHASPHFFLPPPFRDLAEDNLQMELYRILSSLPSSNIGICTKHLVRQVEKSAKSLSKSGYSWNLEVGDPSVIYHSQQKKKSIFLYDKLCLEAILACSTRSSLRNIMMEKGILKVLLKVWSSHKTDLNILSLTAQILANFAMEEKFRKDIYMTGWIGILAEWTKSPFVNLSLPAAKALANLDNDDISHPIYDDGVYILDPLYKLSQKDILADVVFIHGLLGASFWTWRQRGSPRVVQFPTENVNSIDTSMVKKLSMCWPKDWLAVDIPSLRMVAVDYKTCLSSWSSCCFEGKEKYTIKKRAQEIIHKLLLSNVGDRPIIWIAHSMGGLIVKKILMESIESEDNRIKNLAKETAGVVFYSVPHRGSETANRLSSASIIIQTSSDIAELHKGSPTLLSLHEKFRDFVSENDIPVLSFGESKKSRWGLSSSVLVPPDSADPGIGEFYTLPADHLSTCKPETPSSPEYVKVSNFLQAIIFKISSQTSKRYSPEKVFEVSVMLSLIP